MAGKGMSPSDRLLRKKATDTENRRQLWVNRAREKDSLLIFKIRTYCYHGLQQVTFEPLVTTFAAITLNLFNILQPHTAYTPSACTDLLTW